jgi:hypothetical protein
MRLITQTLRAASRAIPFLPWCAWILLTASAFNYVWKYGVNCPIWDEWSMTPALTGQTPLLPWLWAQHNEHRLPVPKLIFYAVTRASGYDFRTGMYLNVAALSLLSLLLMATARKLRGGSSVADVFFPLALLHWGHYENYLMAYQAAFVCPVALAGVVLAVIAASGPRTLSASLAVGLCLLLLPLCGAVGLTLLPALALWAGCTAVCRWRQATVRDKVGLAGLAALAAGAVLLGGFYLQGCRRPDGMEATPNLGAVLGTSVNCLAVGLGPGTIPGWPAATAVMLGLLLLGGALLLRTLLQRQDSLRAVGLSLFLAATAMLVLGIGWGRAALGTQAGHAPRYALLVTPLLCAIFFACQLYAGRLGRRAAPMGLCLLMGVCFLFNAQDGREFGYWRRHFILEFERDLRAGVPARELAERHAAFLCPGSVGRRGLEGWLRTLHDARIGVFQRLRDDETQASPGSQGTMEVDSSSRIDATRRL